jgi:TfoX/Sxy family transcriptional regulator of competence genes
MSKKAGPSKEPRRNAQGVRQVTPDPEWPNVKVPDVEAEVEYLGQKKLYESRVARAREDKQKREAEAERERERQKDLARKKVRGSSDRFGL